VIRKQELKVIYDEHVDNYEQVCIKGKALLKNALDERGIELLHVSHRVKAFESFYEKISRKKYKNPYEETEDICGLRVICFYINDLPFIDEIISKTFTIKESIDKTFNSDTDRFGYRSNHYIVTIPNEPALENYKIEVQTRTVLMHTWAHIQGKLEYKLTEHSPLKFRRKLSQLSALLELADEQFQTLKKDKSAFRTSLITSQEGFSASTELNIDTFLTFMDIYFPNKQGSYRYSKLLMIELLKQQITFDHILKGYNTLSNQLDLLEQDLEIDFTREDMLKIILSITIEGFYENFIEDEFLAKHTHTIQKWNSVAHKDLK